MSKSPWASASRMFACTPTGTPSCDLVETGTAGPTAIVSARSFRRSVRRPASKSPARVDGATTVTSWPNERSASATPATWSFTSCGCDHANGVTRQMRTCQGFRNLPRRRLHQVRARAFERAGNPVVQRELGEAHGVDHDAGGVRGVPNLELEL